MMLSESRQRVLDIARGELHVQADKGKRYDSDGRIKQYIESVVHDGEERHIGEQFREGHHWCAGFVSWVYLQAGYPFKHAEGVGHFGCHLLIKDMDRQGHWYDSKYDPSPGDLIFIAWNKHDLTLGPDDTLPANEAATHVRHVGIVEAFDGDNEIRTIEGNWKGGVNRAIRYFTTGRVIGFGSPLEKFD